MRPPWIHVARPPNTGAGAACARRTLDDDDRRRLSAMGKERWSSVGATEMDRRVNVVRKLFN